MNENNIEYRIEGEFEYALTYIFISYEFNVNFIYSRLVGSIRASDDVASALILSKVWDKTDRPALPGSRTANALIGDEKDDEEDEELTFLNDLRAASGIGRVKKSSRSKGKNKAKSRVRILSVSPSFSSLILLDEYLGTETRSTVASLC